jgi:hypothetical protein
VLLTDGDKVEEDQARPPPLTSYPRQEDESMKYILDFCGNCGVLLTEGLGLETDPECANCNADVRETSSRIQGEFTEEGAKRYLNPDMYAAQDKLLGVE